MKAIYQQGNGELLIKKLSTYNDEYFFKLHDNVNYVSFGNQLFVHSKNSSFKNGLFLFGMVKQDFNSYLLLNKKPLFIDSYKPSFTSKNEIKANTKTYSYDINHAYWRIAYINGYISENTYNHGLRLKNKDDNMKQLYCMALSVQGNTKTLDGYVGNIKTGNKIVIDKNPIHRLIYANIRNLTHKIMDELAYMLGEDFISYNVDCISFKNAKNKIKVENYLKNQNLTFKTVSNK
jgi:hypothetical protein